LKAAMAALVLATAIGIQRGRRLPVPKNAKQVPRNGPVQPLRKLSRKRASVLANGKAEKSSNGLLRRPAGVANMCGPSPKPK
jgi:hypothetical protein